MENTEESFKNMENIVRRSNIIFNQDLGEEIKNGAEAIFEEVLAEKLPELMKDTKFRKPNRDFRSGELKRNLPLNKRRGHLKKQRQIEHGKATRGGGKTLS